MASAECLFSRVVLPSPCSAALEATSGSHSHNASSYSADSCVVARRQSLAKSGKKNSRLVDSNSYLLLNPNPLNGTDYSLRLITRNNTCWQRRHHGREHSGCGRVWACAAPVSLSTASAPPSSSSLATAASHVELLEPLICTEPVPCQRTAKAFAPATIANLGPGFDFIGCAVEGIGDHVIVEISEDVPPGEVRIKSITGDGGRLSLSALENCAGIAAKATLRLLGVRSVGIMLSLDKGLPLGSGLGSSAASAAAAACAVNGLFGAALSDSQLVTAGLVSETAVSGYHADNIAPCMMGGFVLVRSLDPLELIPLEWGSVQSESSSKGNGAKPALYFVIVTPLFEAPTREMRAVLPRDVSFKTHINNSSQGASLVAAILKGDARLLGRAMAGDTIVEPRRTPLIPGMAVVRVSAMAAGAFGCTISGAGPTAVAITDSLEMGEKIGKAMENAFLAVGKLPSKTSVVRLDVLGSRLVDL